MLNLLLRLCDKMSQVQHKFSTHHYFNVCWLSFTNHFPSQLQYMMSVFSLYLIIRVIRLTELPRSRLSRIIDALLRLLDATHICKPTVNVSTTFLSVVIKNVTLTAVHCTKRDTYCSTLH